MAKKTKIFLMLSLFIMILAIIFKPQIFIDSAKNSLSLFGLAVFPSLFPFLFFSTILTSIGAGYELGKISKRPIGFLFDAPPIGGYVWVMSLLAGFPVTAKIIEDIHLKGIVDEEQSRKMLTFTQTSPPLFVLGTIGVSMLSSYKAGFIILISQYIGSFLSGIILRKKTKKKTNNQTLTFDIDNILQKGMEKSIVSVLLIGGYIIIFSLFLEFFNSLGIINYISNFISKLGVDVKISNGIISGLFEVTNGALKLSELNVSLSIISTIICFLLSFGGISIIMQSMSFLSNAKIKLFYFIKTRLIIAILSTIICYILTILLL